MLEKGCYSIPKRMHLDLIGQSVLQITLHKVLSSRTRYRNFKGTGAHRHDTLEEEIVDDARASQAARQRAYSGESVHVFRGKVSACSEDIRPRVPKESVRAHRSV